MRILDHPYQNLTGGGWVRGNLHTHTTNSDGKRDPQRVIDDYAERGYDFLAISDHDIHTGPAEYQAWNSRGLVLIPGNEISAGGPHLLHVNSDRRLEPVADRQQIIEQAREGSGFIVVNHPNWGWFNHCPYENLKNWQGYAGMEIYNGVISRLEGSPYALNEWDLLLCDRRRVWGFANDDSHADQDAELGWNVAYVQERTPQAIVEALRNGCFYASTGVIINSIQVDGMRVRIETENAERIIAMAALARRIKVVDGPILEIEVPPEIEYLRLECWGRGEKFAWTQPFFPVDA